MKCKLPNDFMVNEISVLPGFYAISAMIELDQGWVDTFNTES